ncbi:cysteine desulfurase family protein [Sphingomicrobium flavum]|uniref:cysteine desulfurase family protein n=1 Tax=Sphingomicrobium flavum TaxID=1229164 RepID=UPI0021ADC869|nr:aminotransferase class V-fold PLP-dependent enzyme [Sphingomicrobium flavum]
MTRQLYFDHAAATPIHPEAREAIAKAMDDWANPNAPHADARNSRKMLEDARKSLGAALDWDHDVVFTSGASEAVSIAAKRACCNGRVYGATEHAIVPATMGEASKTLPVDRHGLVDMDALDEALAGDPCLVAIQHVNNETGVIQDIEAIYAKVQAAGALLLADCAQSAAKIDLPDADFIATSGYKLGGPPGIGALLIKDLSSLEACGGQEKGYRRGTQNVPGAVGMAAAASAGRFKEAMPRLKMLRQKLEDAVESLGGSVIGKGAPRIPTIGAIALPGVPSNVSLVQLDLAGISVAAGSACSSGKMKPSHVLEAMQVEADQLSNFLRISFGANTSDEDVDGLIAELTRIVERTKAA